jgi:adenylate kinase
MNKLAIFGGCSNAGKTTITQELSMRCGFPAYRKFDLVKNEMRFENVCIEDIFDLYDDLELKAFINLNTSHHEEIILLDAHYAIQKDLDDLLALGKGNIKRSLQKYIQSFCHGTIDYLAKNLNLQLFIVTAPPATILYRRFRNLKQRYIIQRDTDIESIVEEIEAEKAMFDQFYLQASNSSIVQKYIIDNSTGIDSALHTAEKCLRQPV